METKGRKNGNGFPFFLYFLPVSRDGSKGKYTCSYGDVGYEIADRTVDVPKWPVPAKTNQSSVSIDRSACR